MDIFQCTAAHQQTNAIFSSEPGEPIRRCPWWASFEPASILIYGCGYVFCFCQDQATREKEVGIDFVSVAMARSVVVLAVLIWLCIIVVGSQCKLEDAVANLCWYAIE